MIFFAFALIWEHGKHAVFATIDVNLAELEYLAARLDPYECRVLAASLHYDDYELPKNLDAAEQEISEDIPCLGLLVHWNQEARGETHEHLEHRLRQLGHAGLADWLGRTAFREIGEDLLRLIDEPIATTTTESPVTETPTAETTCVSEVTISQVIHHDTDDEGIWVVIDVIALLLFALLLFTFIVFVGLLIIDRFARCRNQRPSQREEDNEERNLLTECQD